MATGANRAATAANKKGGGSRRRNRSVQEFDRHHSLDSKSNREAFVRHQRETRARRRNAAMNSLMSEGVSGIPEGFALTLGRSDRTPVEKHRSSSRFRLWSSSFGKGGEILARHTGDDLDLSPSMQWNRATPTIEEYALICEDISVPPGSPPLTHWLIYRIPGGTLQLPEGIPSGESVASVLGALQGTNDFGRVGYSGPLPPFYDPWHHYRFRIFALDRALNRLYPGMTREELFKHLPGHIVAESEVLGRYRRTRWTLRSTERSAGRSTF